MTDLNDLFKVIAEGKKHYEDTTVVGQTIKQVKQNAKSDLSILFEQLTSLKEDLEKELVVAVAAKEQQTINEIATLVAEETLTEEIPAQPIIHTPEVRATQVSSDVDKYLTNKSFQQPQPDLVDKNVEDIRNKIKFLEQAIGRIAAAGPGGGEVNLRWLDDVDRSTITDGWYLRYSETKKKFEFAEVISSGGNGATGVQGPAGATGPGITYASGYVNAGSFVTLDNIKATVTTSGNRGLALATVSGTISSLIGAYTTFASGSFTYGTTSGASPYSITTSTGNTSIFNWSFGNASDTAIYHVNDLTNSKFYRITMMIGGGYNNNAISIERLI